MFNVQEFVVRVMPVLHGRHGADKRQIYVSEKYLRHQPIASILSSRSFVVIHKPHTGPQSLIELSHSFRPFLAIASARRHI